MDHWEFNDEIKEAARKRRRLRAKIEIKDGLAELEEEASQPSQPASTEEQ